MPDLNPTLIFLPKPFERWPIQRIFDLATGLNYDFTPASAEIGKPCKIHIWSTHNSNPDAGSIIDGPDALALWAFLIEKAIRLETKPGAYLATDCQE